MAASPNPTGAPRKNESVLREKHLRFIGAALANAYSPTEIVKMLEQEYGTVVTRQTIQHYAEEIRTHGANLEIAIKQTSDYSEANVAKVVAEAKLKARLSALFVGFFVEKKKIAEDPTFGIPMADKRRRIMKLSQNIEELDEPKTFSKGSYPLERKPDGSMSFVPFEIKNKDHAEQRKSIEAIGELVDGNVGGDVIIQVVNNDVPEESQSALEQKAREQAEDLKKKLDANKPATHEPKESNGGDH